MSPLAQTYDRLRNIKLTADEHGICWQTAYCRLKKEGVKIVGDKLRYGADRDKLGAKAEAEFKRIVPFAKDKNDDEFQAKYDFDVNGLKVDVKCSMPRKLNNKYEALSWAFSFKRQSNFCDFFCCFCFDENRACSQILLVPKEFFDGLQTISVACNGRSKWNDYKISEADLKEFFENYSESN